MSAQIGDRPVLRPAGNIVIRADGRHTKPVQRKVTKPPSLPPVKSCPPSTISPPNSPKTPPIATPPSRTPQPNPPSRLTPDSPQFKLLLQQSVRKSFTSNSLSRPTSFQINFQADTTIRSRGTKTQPSTLASTYSKESLSSKLLSLDCTKQDQTIPDPLLSESTASSEGSACDNTLVIPSEFLPESSKGLGRKTVPSIHLMASSEEIFHKASTKAPGKSRRNVSKPKSLSTEETASNIQSISAARKAAAIELHTQKKLRVSQYGRITRGKASRVAPDVSILPPLSAELKRCKFITPQRDTLSVAYHDEEWGVPVLDDGLLFELLVLVGAQAELTWSTILSRRNAYRVAFAGFDPSVVARFSEKQISILQANNDLMLPQGKIRSVVENARRILEIVKEFGSFHSYLWAFVNNKPMINNYRYPKQIPVKTSKAEAISKDLVKRGLRLVGPTVMYSFMQAAGMTNDHLVQCFRHNECVQLWEDLQAYSDDQKQGK